jgi:hypothetical protein
MYLIFSHTSNIGESGFVFALEKYPQLLHLHLATTLQQALQVIYSTSLSLLLFSIVKIVLQQFS